MFLLPNEDQIRGSKKDPECESASLEKFISVHVHSTVHPKEGQNVKAEVRLGERKVKRHMFLP